MKKILNISLILILISVLGVFVMPLETRAAVPAAPSGLSATVLTSSSIRLNWQDNSTDEAGFRIYRQDSPIANVSANSSLFTDATGLSPATLYTYYVKAYNADGDSSSSNSASATTLALPTSCQTSAECKSGEICDFSTSTCIAVGASSPVTSVSGVDSLIRSVARWIAILISIVAVIFIILGGVSYLTAGGNEEKAKAARNKIMYGLIGLAVAALAWGAEALVRSFLKLGQ